MELRTIMGLLAIIGPVSWAFGIDKVVYGPDDRLDIFEVSNSVHREAARSTAGMIPLELLSLAGESYVINGESLRSRGICQEEKFTNQLTAANCSGFLVAKDLLVTAGHCVRSLRDCQSSAWVFDYALTAGEQIDVSMSVPKNSVYRCSAVLETVLDYDTENDYALIRLDREVTDRAPLAVRKTGKIEDNTGIVVIGHPTGLPTKVADNANVRNNSNPYFFVANLDTFGGNSGSAVLDTHTGLVEGILVRGEVDYEYDMQSGCKKVKYCDDRACRGEDVTRITNIKKLMDILQQTEI